MTVLSRLLREPLLHFLVAGGLLFAAHAQLNDPGEAADERRVLVTPQLRELVRGRFARLQGRFPSAEEEQRALEEWVREEILYREGMRLGLAQNDPVTRRRIGQRVMLLADAAVPMPPDEATLRAWFESQRDRYTSAVRYSLRQVFLAPSGDDAGDRERAELLLRDLQDRAAPAPPAGDATLLPAALDAASAQQVRNRFGNAFEAQLARAPLRRWTGPLTSAFGLHLVFVSARGGGEVPGFESVRPQVERDWLYERTQAAREALFRELRANYEVIGISDGAGAR